MGSWQRNPALEALGSPRFSLVLQEPLPEQHVGKGEGQTQYKGLTTAPASPDPGDRTGSPPRRELHFSRTRVLPKRVAEASLLFVLSNHFTNISKALCN